MSVYDTCKELTSIDLRNEKDITDVGVSSLTEGCSQLVIINVARCDQLTDVSLAAIGETCKGLTSIDMSWRNEKDITDVGVSSLTEGCSQIVIINVARCDQLTDASLAAIGETCKGLTSIDMTA